MDISVLDEDSAAANLTSATARFVMARTPTSSVLVDSNASPQTATVEFTSAVTGNVRVTMDNSMTASLLEDYYYELKVTDSGGREVVTTRGWITVEPSLT